MLALQQDPQEMIDKMVEVIEAKHHPFRTVYPEAAELLVKENERKIWDEKI